MGYPRKPHQGTLGGGNVGTGGSETWIHCHGCHQRITPERLGEPCPAYRFPAFTLAELLMRLGELDVPVLLRVDPLRAADRCTILLHELRLPDTAAPLELLVTVLGALLAQDALTPISQQLKRLQAADRPWRETLAVDLSAVGKSTSTSEPGSLQKTRTTAGVPLQSVPLDRSAVGSTGGSLPSKAASPAEDAARWSATTDLGETC
jgi:hypothetical protein